MEPIDSTNKVQPDHPDNKSTEADTPQRGPEIAGGTEQRLRFVIERTKSDIETHRARLRSYVESIANDARGLVREVENHGTDSVSTRWIEVHVSGLVDAKDKLAASRDTLAELERLLEL
jgi:hypothetical protein